MNLKFHRKIDEKTWNQMLSERKYSPFFQTLEWGDIEKNNGTTVEQYDIFEGNKRIGVMQIFEKNAKRGHFLHVRHGPVLKKWTKTNTRELACFLKKLAVEKNATFVRISPLIFEDDTSALRYLKNEGFRFSPVYNVDAENRWVLALSESEEILLSQMRKTTRYMIRKGEKEGIVIISNQTPELFKRFEKIYTQTALKKGFVPHKLVREEFEYFQKKGKARLYLAEQNKKILAGALIIYSGDSAIYRHGATSELGRKTPASYLLQWQAIKDAKKEGLKYYDFWGISKDENPKNPWHGLSSFKRGFGGGQVDYLHSLDLPVSLKYWITFSIDFLTTVRKGHFLR